MAHAHHTLPNDTDLSGAERMALWSLRHVIRDDPPRCRSASPRIPHGFDADLGRVATQFRNILDQLDATLRLDTPASLSLNNDERLLLRCLARMQSDEASDDTLAAILPDPRLAAFLSGALVELAAALATGGYWLPARAH